MNQNDMFVLVLLFLLAVTLVACAYMVTRYLAGKKTKRRRWARIRVPNQNAITCRISEPSSISGDAEYLINDINVGGISFFTDREIAKTVLKLAIRFPFTSFADSSAVWGKVVYCNRLENPPRYRVGIAYVRHTKRSK